MVIYEVRYYIICDFGFSVIVYGFSVIVYGGLLNVIYGCLLKPINRPMQLANHVFMT